MHIPKGAGAVMSSRVEPPDSLEFFPTPPWATRALIECVLGTQPSRATAWEPAAGEGHMSEVLSEYFSAVHASDVHDYGRGYAVGSFVGYGLDIIPAPADQPDWIVTNPPFGPALEFTVRALAETKRGVAIFARSNWAEGKARYEGLFRDNPPTIIAQFVERVPLVKGRWDPDASTATSYSWFVWDKRFEKATAFEWIPPGQRERLERPDDRRRFARATNAPLLGEVSA